MTGLIIIAAGESKRLGQPKQNLLYKNKTLLQGAIATALDSECRPVIVVLGANADMIDPGIQHEDLKTVFNPDWNEGMASSIRTGINEIRRSEEIDSAVIMLCDQPFVSAELINSMTRKHRQTGKALVACSYNNTAGVPVLFDKVLFPELFLLKGNEGAKKLLKEHPQDMVTVPFDSGSIDIDTMDDYNRLLGLTD